MPKVTNAPGTVVAHLLESFPPVPPDQEAEFKAHLEETRKALNPRNTIEDLLVLDHAYYAFQERELSQILAGLLEVTRSETNDQAFVLELDPEHDAVMEAGTYQAYMALSQAEQRELQNIVTEERAVRSKRPLPFKRDPTSVGFDSDSLVATLSRNAALVDQVTRELAACQARRTASLRELERLRISVEKPRRDSGDESTATRRRRPK